MTFQNAERLHPTSSSHASSRLLDAALASTSPKQFSADQQSRSSLHVVEDQRANASSFVGLNVRVLRSGIRKDSKGPHKTKNIFVFTLL